MPDSVEPAERSTYNRYAQLFGPTQAGALLITLLLLFGCARYSFLLFHSVVEILRIVVLGGVFVLAWHTRRMNANAFLTVFGIAGPFIAIPALLHTLTYKGMGVVPGIDANLPTQLWIAFRYLEAASVLLAAAWIGRPVPAGALLGGYATATAFGLTAILGGAFPDCFVEGEGLTPFKIGSEYAIIALFTAGLVLLHRRRAHFPPDVLGLLLASIGCGILSEFAFTRYASVFGMANEVGHYLLFISAYLIYRAVLVSGLIAPVRLLFRTLKEKEGELERLLAERTAALRRSEALNAAFIENSPSVIYLTDRDGRYTLANAAFEQLVRRPRGEILGRASEDLFPPEVAAHLARCNEETLHSGQASVRSERVVAATGERLFEVVHFPLRDAAGIAIGTGGIATDVTELRQAETRYASMVRTSMDALVVIDREGRFLEVNDATCELSGYTREQLLTMAVAHVEARLDAAAVTASLRRIEQAGSARFDSRWRRRNGELREVEVSVTYIRDVSPPCFFSFIRDITEQKAASARIEHLAHYDQLTGLPNRQLFETRAREALRAAAHAGTPCALVFLDLDNFKVINDTLGHLVGDALLRHFAERLRTAGGGALIGRTGGDEFLILLDAAPLAEAPEAFVEGLLADLARPLQIDQHELVSTVSAGISRYPRDGADFDALMKAADSAMFAAKAAGRNALRVFDEALQADAHARLQLLASLRGALARDEFRLHYQPQVDLASGRIVGAEALIRWQHPQLGMVPPGRFIPLAEDSGLIVPIGTWVLREACRQAVAWQRAGLPRLVVAVNLSALQFRRHDLYQTVVDALAESGLEPACLELELTESLLITDADAVLQTVRRLKSLGLQLSIDDFGTGYSSLAYLKRFAVDKLKIDQSFVRDMDREPESFVLVRAVIQMAHSLGLRAIAEGVEDARLLKPLAQLRCDEVQGYHLGRPMPAADLAEHLRRHAHTTIGVPE